MAEAEAMVAAASTGEAEATVVDTGNLSSNEYKGLAASSCQPFRFCSSWQALAVVRHFALSSDVGPRGASPAKFLCDPR